MYQLAVFPTPPSRVMAGYRTPVKSLWLPPNPTMMYVWLKVFMVTPVWILWIIRAKLTDWGGRALSDATVAFGRCEASFSLGLWHSTHISIWLRFSPCSER